MTQKFLEVNLRTVIPLLVYNFLFEKYNLPRGRMSIFKKSHRGTISQGQILFDY